MELFTPSVFAVAIPAVIFAGISKGGFGSGVAFASASILAIVLDPGVALGLMLPLLMLIDVASLPAYWRKWDWASVRVLLIGSLPGTILGALFYAWTDPDAIRLLIGSIALLFVAWRMAQATRLIRLGETEFSPGVGLALGGLLGFTSFVSHAGGPAASVYLLGRKLGKTTFQSTTVLIFWAVNLSKSGIYAGMGIFTWDMLKLDLFLIPFALLGTWLGVKAHHMLPERLFFGIAYVALTLTGAKLVFDALT
ncbi:sulfite exporter TauE/SafE family protein [Mameliella sp.]|uniref:sulfite exporter TauE/SafE family protein n=1 Tax=Mameliella sp. TaxID=1924940 RepID=UPI003B50D96B